MGTNYYEKFCKTMEKNTKGVEIGIYSIAGGLLIYSLYRRRPITRFSKPSEIPTHFVKEKIIQNGTVVRIEPSQIYGPLLIVKHQPPVNFFFNSDKRLPIKLPGIKVNANGYAWLQTIVAQKQIQFLPLSNKTNYAAECQVILLEQNKKPLDVGTALLSLGFAQSVSVPREIIPPNDKKLQKYFERLTNAEKRAKSKRAGMWAEQIPPPAWPVRVAKNSIDSLLFAVIPKRFENLRLPELVR